MSRFYLFEKAIDAREPLRASCAAMDQPRLLSARQAIETLGGPALVGEMLGMPSALTRCWALDNVVPEKHHARFLALCVREGVYWRPHYWPRQAQLRWHDCDAELVVA